MATVVAKKVVAKKVAAPAGLQGYNVKLKQSDDMNDTTINITNGRYIAKGTGSDGTTVTKIMSKVGAEEAIANGWATEGEGFAPASPAKKVVLKKK